MKTINPRAVALLAAMAATAAAPAMAGSSDLVGRYPWEVFEADPALRARVEAVLGPKDSEAFDDLAVNAPFEKQGAWVVGTVCMPRNCGENGMAIAFGPKGSVIVAVKRDGSASLKGDPRGAPLPAEIRAHLR